MNKKILNNFENSHNKIETLWSAVKEVNYDIKKLDKLKIRYREENFLVGTPYFETDVEELAETYTDPYIDDQFRQYVIKITDITEEQIAYLKVIPIFEMEEYFFDNAYISEWGTSDYWMKGEGKYEFLYKFNYSIKKADDTTYYIIAIVTGALRNLSYTTKFSLKFNMNISCITPIKYNEILTNKI